jgi:hypothetical protein
MIEQEIEQARADVDQLDVEQLRCGVLLQLLHIEALKKERDEWLARHYTFTEAQRKTIVEWSRHNPDRCAKALENWIPSDDYETVKLALETERNAANLYAKQVAHWIEKHDALLAQQPQTVPQEWNDKNVLAWCVARGIKAAQPEPGVKMVPIRQLFDANGIQVCDTGHESCHFYVPAIVPNFSASCNHTQRGIPDNKPHRLCPVLHESNK